MPPSEYRLHNKISLAGCQAVLGPENRGQVCAMLGSGGSLAGVSSILTCSAGDPPGQLHHKHQLQQHFQQCWGERWFVQWETGPRYHLWKAEKVHRLPWVKIISSSATEYLSSERHLQNREGSRQSGWKNVIHYILQYCVLTKLQGDQFKTGNVLFLLCPMSTEIL